MSIRGRLTTGPRIARLREQNGFTKSSFATAVGVTPTCVWNWENGNTFPKPDKLPKVASLLKSTPEFLRDGEAVPGEKQRSAAADQGTIADAVAEARRLVATAAGLDIDDVRIVLDYGG